MPLPHYVYKDTERPSEIRLLKLPPVNSQPGTLEGLALKHVLLGDRPEYYAVSYAWGSQALNIPLTVNQNATLQITRSLWAAICAFSRRYPGNYLWIDQISINQASNQDKSEQVNMMTQIYAQSKCSLVWLGEENQSTEAGFEMVNYLESLHLLTDYTFINSTHLEIRQKLAQRHGSDIIPTIDDSRWNAVMKIFQRSWFCRLWTLQEVVVAKKVVFFCGVHSCTQKALVQAASLIGRDCPFAEEWWMGISTCQTVGQFRRSYHDRVERPVLELILDTVQKFGCTDPRDRIFAFLGLQSTGLRSCVPADYEAKVADVYTHFAKTMIMQSSSLQILTLGASHSGKIEGLPSWVPDWSIPTKAATLDWLDPTKFRFHASGSFHYRDETSTLDWRTKHLRVAGNIVDRVQAVIDIEFQAYSPPLEHIKRFERLMLKYVELSAQRWEQQTLSSSVELDLLIKLVRTLLVDGFVRVFRMREKGWPEADWSDQTIRKMLARLAVRRSTIDCARPTMDPDLDEWLAKLDIQLELCCGRRVAMLENHMIGLCPNQSQPGDLVCVVHGANMPLVLRECSPASDVMDCRGYDLQYMHVGPCFVDGIMHGEAVDWTDEGATVLTLV